MSRFIILLTLATAAVYAALLFQGVVRMTPEAGGLPPFDVRIGGYGEDEARAYLAALSDEGKRLLLGPVRTLDTIFPPMLGLLLALLIFVNGRVWLALVPFGYTAADLWENATVGAMVVANDPAMGPAASNLTQGKYALLILSLAILWMAWRDRKRAESG